MRYELKPYQADAVGQLIETLERAEVEWHRDGRVSSTALTATTGAGKTVMAAAVIESLFYGSERFESGSMRAPLCSGSPGFRL